MQATRRKFFGLIGAAPIAAKATSDAALGRAAGVSDISGIGNGSLGLSYGAPAGDEAVPYAQRIIGAADYIKMFGVPDVMEFELRDRSRNVYCLDPDIASKSTWSMAFKITLQRQRNYERAVEQIDRSGWRSRGLGRLKQFLGYDWPW
jgi:hypothetical protein